MQVVNLDAYFTELMWYPVSSKKNQAGGTDVFAVACTDGGSLHGGKLSSICLRWMQAGPGQERVP